MIYIFIAIGAVMILSVIISLVKIVKGKGGTGAQSDSGDKETKKLCAMLDGEQLFSLAKDLEDDEGEVKDFRLWGEFMRTAAEKGYAPAMREYGKDCKCGNNDEALLWLERAAEAGDIKAGLELAECYKYGVKYGKPVIEADKELAKKWYLRLAETGDAAAQNEYAEYLKYYEDNDEEAELWYKKAAEQGNAEALNALADMYYLGDDDQDDKALEIYFKAAQAGSTDAELSLGN